MWCGNEAIDINLVNEIGGLKDALDYAAVTAGLSSYRTVEYPKAMTNLDKLMDNFGTASKALDAAASPESIIEKLYQSLKAETGIYARMPYIYMFE